MRGFGVAGLTLTTLLDEFGETICIYILLLLCKIVNFDNN